MAIPASQVVTEVFRSVEPAFSDEQGKNHDKCVVLKVSVQTTSGLKSFLFTGDANKSALDSIVGKASRSIASAPFPVFSLLIVFA